MDPQNTPAPKQASSGETVTIACKLPHGIVLHADQMVESQEIVQGGGTRAVKKAMRLPGEFTVAGNAFPEGSGPRARMEFGFAITTGCPKELWERWLHANKDSPMVKNGLIFAHGRENSAVAEAREKEGVRSGFERLDPAKLPKGIQKAAATA